MSTKSIRCGDGALSTINPLWYYRAGAGPLPDVTIYSLQLMTSVLGPVRRADRAGEQADARTRMARRETSSIEVPDNHVVLIEFASGAIVTAIGADAAGSRSLTGARLNCLARTAR